MGSPKKASTRTRLYDILSLLQSSHSNLSLKIMWLYYRVHSWFEQTNSLLPPRAKTYLPKIPVHDTYAPSIQIFRNASIPFISPFIHSNPLDYSLLIGRYTFARLHQEEADQKGQAQAHDFSNNTNRNEYHIERTLEGRRQKTYSERHGNTRLTNYQKRA